MRGMLVDGVSADSGGKDGMLGICSFWLGWS